jgi:hypothetical protein
MAVFEFAYFNLRTSKFSAQILRDEPQPHAQILLTAGDHSLIFAGAHETGRVAK